MKYLILFTCLAFLTGYLLMISPALEELDSARNKEDEHKNLIERKQRQYTNLDVLKKQFIQIISMSESLSQAMPLKIDIDTEGSRLVTSAGRYGLTPVTLVFENDIKPREFYKQYPIRLSLTGVFDDIYLFLYDEFYSTDRAITLTGFTLEKIENSNRLVLQADGYLFEYIPEAEER